MLVKRVARTYIKPYPRESFFFFIKSRITYFLHTEVKYPLYIRILVNSCFGYDYSKWFLPKRRKSTYFEQNVFNLKIVPTFWWLCGYCFALHVVIYPFQLFYILLYSKNINHFIVSYWGVWPLFILKFFFHVSKIWFNLLNEVLIYRGRK